MGGGREIPAGRLSLTTEGLPATCRDAAVPTGSTMLPGPPDRSASAGRVKRKTAPRGSFAPAHNRPPCASTIERRIDRPSPNLPGLVVWNASNSRPSWAGSSPGPVSRTATSTPPPLARLGADQQLAQPLPRAAHRLDHVHDQVQDQLLQLHPVAADRRQARRERRPHRDIVLRRLAAGLGGCRPCGSTPSRTAG